MSELPDHFDPSLAYKSDRPQHTEPRIERPGTAGANGSAGNANGAPDEEARRAAILARHPALDLHRLVSQPRPPREWVIESLFPAGAACAVVGKSGGGKSLLTFAAMIDVAAGRRKFAGLPIPRARRVLYIDTENTEDDLWERATDYGVTAATDLSQLTFLHLPNLAPLDKPKGGAELAEIVWAYRLTAGDVLVLDSIQRVTVGPENDSDTMRAYYRCTGQGLKRAGLAVIRTDNTGKDPTRGERGSSGKRDDQDVSWWITTSGTEGQYLNLHPGKVRIPDVHDLQIERVSREEGGFTYSTRLDPRQGQIRKALALLDQLGLPADASMRDCERAAKGSTLTRQVIRAAAASRASAVRQRTQTG